MERVSKMDNKIIELLIIVQEGRNRQGSQHYTYPDDFPQGYNKSNIDYYRKLGLLGKKGNVLHLTPLGYQTLNAHYSLEASKSSNKTNQEMLKYTKRMKSLTWWILGFTIANLIFIGIQIYFLLK